MELLYMDSRIVVCCKPAGVLSTDEPGGMPELLRQALGEGTDGCVRVVHRLDRPVGGVMVFARSRVADRLLSGQVQRREFEKEYLAVIEGILPEKTGLLEDWLLRDRRTRKTIAVSQPGPETRPAALKEKRAEPCPHPASDRAHTPDPGAVLLPRVSALRRPEIRHEDRRRYCPLVIPDRIFPSADGRTDGIFCSAAGRRAVGGFFGTAT